jgi:acyl dehydratase
MPDWRSYDEFHVGDSFPEAPYRYVVSAGAAGDLRTLTARARGGEPRAEREVAPPMLAAIYIRGAQNALRGPPGGIHAKQRFQFLGPVRVGDALETTLVVKDKYEKKGRRYVVSETRTINQRGEEVTRGEIVSIWGGQR